MNSIWRRTSEKFTSWFRGLTGSQATIFYLGLVSVALLTVTHNPSEGYTREVYGFWVVNKEEVQIMQSTGYQLLSESLSNSPPVRWFSRPVRWFIDPRGWTSQGALDVRWLPNVQGLFDYIKILTFVVLGSLGIIKLIGIRENGTSENTP